MSYSYQHFIRAALVFCLDRSVTNIRIKIVDDPTYDDIAEVASQVYILSSEKHCCSGRQVNEFSSR